MSMTGVMNDAIDIRAPFPASTANDVNDLLFWDNTNKFAKKASARTDLGTAALNQADFSPLFLGVAMDQRLLGETSVTTVASLPKGPSDRTVRTEGVFLFDCASATFEIGDLVGVARDATNSVNFNQKVVGVATENLAIGYVIRREPTAVTKVWCFVSARRYGWFKTVAGGIGSGANEVNTAVTTVGAATLTAAAFVGGLITRSGSTAAYTDTTPTAALLIAGAPIQDVGTSWELTVKNTTAFAQTLTGGTGATLTGQTIIPPNSVGRFLVTLNSTTTYTMVGVAVGPMTTGPLEVITALSTVGAGTITAAGIAGGATNRTGSTAAFTDTTDTGTNLQAALPNANVGQSFEWTYYNNTAGAATITGGAGVTVSTITLVPSGMWARYLVTLTAANTFTVVGIMMGPCLALPNSQYTSAALSTTTAAAGQLTGAATVYMNNSGANPGTYTTRTGAQMAADLPGIPIGFTYTLYLCNGQGTGTLTLAAGASGVTITGTATVAINVFRVYQVTYTAANTFVFQNVGSGVAP